MARNKYKIARRSIWFVLRTLLIVSGIVALCLAVFAEGMHVSNLYILVTEGLEARAQIIVQGGEPLDLTAYFTEEFIAADAALYEGAYAEFTVSNFDYRMEIKSFFVLPWSVEATMVVDDALAAINAAANSAEGEAPVLPVWTPGRYEVRFVKDGSRWHIDALTLLLANPVTEAKPTPDMSLMTPALSPAPGASVYPSLSPALTQSGTPG